MKTIDDLIEANACKEGINYARKFNTLAEAWEKCEHSDWMWWWLKHNRVSKEVSVVFANDCARQAKEYAAAANDANAYAYTAAAAIAYTAAHAAAAAADAAYAAGANYSKERLRQANFLRTLVPNPFL
jgi:hypothetical protein